MDKPDQHKLYKGIRINRRRGLLYAALLSFFIGLSGAAVASVPEDQQAVLTISGQGVSPNAQISLSTGPQQTIVTKSDRSGHFQFSNLRYGSFRDLKFSLNIPPFKKGLSSNFPATALDFSYDPYESIARMSGTIGKSGTLAFLLNGADTSHMQVAGTGGFVSVQARTQQSLASGKSSLVASIVNAGEVCCPRMIIPASPITLTIMSEPLVLQPPIPPPAVKPAQSSTQSPARIQPKTNTAPYVVKPAPVAPQPDTAPKDEPAPKKKIPYIVQGHVETETITIAVDEIAAATSFPEAKYDATYVGGLKRIADEMRNAIMLEVAAVGAMLDGRNLMDSLRSIQISTVQTLRNYTPSNQVCRFGTLTKSVALADAVTEKNKLAFSKVLTDRNINKVNSLHSDPQKGMNARIVNFRKTYCDKVDNNGFLDGYCELSGNVADQMSNRDVDFTRVFDVPLTIDADFSDESKSKDKDAVIALFSNLNYIPPYMGAGSDAFDPSQNAATVQDIRRLEAMRTLTANTFGAVVGEKAKVTSASKDYMLKMIENLGVSADDAKKLISENPSYFAQMEVMTKKLFQDPSFYANLYDSEANVDRQRVAMKAIELQQDRDFLESLRRREILLSVLLNAKLQIPANRANEAGYLKKQ